jgi:membrane protease YdiL (CAAX protease family)
MSATDVPAASPALLIPVVFLVVLFQAGLAEEVGWRGYALPGLQQRYGALASSIILGVLWWLWHFHPQNYPALKPMAFWYLYGILPTTVILTWVYNNTSGSILLAVLFHTANNVADWIVPTSPAVTGIGTIRPYVIQGTLAWIVALCVVKIYGGRHLSRQGPSQT